MPNKTILTKLGSCTPTKVEFSFHDYLNRSTSKKPFQIVYGFHPKGPMELRELPTDFKTNAKGEELEKIIKQVQE